MADSCSDLDPGLSRFTVEDLCHPAQLTEAILNKLQRMPPGRWSHERLETEVRLMLAMVRDAACGGFRRLPLTALTDFLAALHYFLKWRDRCPDTQEGGYRDDLEVALRATSAHAQSIAAYREWLAAREPFPNEIPDPVKLRTVPHPIPWSLE